MTYASGVIEVRAEHEDLSADVMPDAAAAAELSADLMLLS